MIKTLSIPRDMEEFLKENPDLSPSKMLQSKIIEIRESKKINQVEIIKLKRVINNLQTKLWEANERVEFLERKKTD